MYFVIGNKRMEYIKKYKDKVLYVLEFENSIKFSYIIKKRRLKSKRYIYIFKSSNK